MLTAVQVMDSKKFMFYQVLHYIQFIKYRR